MKFLNEYFAGMYSLMSWSTECIALYFLSVSPRVIPVNISSTGIDIERTFRMMPLAIVFKLLYKINKHQSRNSKALSL